MLGVPAIAATTPSVPSGLSAGRFGTPGQGGHREKWRLDVVESAAQPPGSVTCMPTLADTAATTRVPLAFFQEGLGATALLLTPATNSGHLQSHPPTPGFPRALVERYNAKRVGRDAPHLWPAGSAS